MDRGRHLRMSASLTVWLIVGQLLIVGGITAAAELDDAPWQPGELPLLSMENPEPAAPARFAFASEDREQSNGQEAESKSEDGPNKTKNDQKAEKDQKDQQKESAGEKSKFDQDLVRRGQGYFDSACTACH